MKEVYAYFDKIKEDNQINPMACIDDIISLFNIPSVKAKSLFMDWAKDNMYAKNVTSTPEGTRGFAKLIGLPPRTIDKRILLEEKQNAEPKEGT